MRCTAIGSPRLRGNGCVLMTNHVHLLVTPRTVDSVARTMQSLGRRYVRHINATYRRTGTLWEGRYRAAPIDGEAYFLACCRYIELNPTCAESRVTINVINGLAEKSALQIFNEGC